MRKRYLRVAILLLCLSLTSCSSNYRNNFDCKSGIGLGCKSVSEVNNYVSEGKISNNGNYRVWVAPNYDIGEIEGSFQYLDKVEVNR